MPTEADNQTDRPLKGALALCVDFCQHRAVWVVFVSALISVLAAFYLAINIRIDTNTENMLSKDLPFRQNATALDKEFPILQDNLLIVLEAPNADAADDGAGKLVAAMQAKPDIFSTVFSVETDPFLRRNGFLYIDVPALEEMANRLAAAQPFLGTLWRAPNLDGLADLLALFAEVEGADTQSQAEAAGVLDAMAVVAGNVRKGSNSTLVWSDVISGSKPLEGPVRRLILAKPKLDYGSLHPAERAQTAIFKISEELGLHADGTRIRLTGATAMESDELKSVEVGMGLAGVISLVLVLLILLIGLRSIGVMVALLVTLLIGLLWTAAFAILAFGALNLISVAFAVLFVGLSVDFGIHFSLRASEYTGAGETWPKALVLGGRGVGSSLFVCAGTSSIAFFSFAPTAYVGLAELGMIAGVSMFIALLTNLTVLPAMLRLLVKKPPHYRHPGADQPAEHKILHKWAPTIVGIGLLSACIAGWLAKDARFDFDPMNLKDPQAPSVQTLFDLWADDTVHPYSADILVSNIKEGEALAARLQKLDGVARVESISDLIPEAQSEKLEIIDRMALLLGPAFLARQGALVLPESELGAAVQRVLTQLAKLDSNETLAPAARRLRASFSDADAKTASRISQALFGSLPGRLNMLMTALEAGPVDIEVLPDNLKSRYLSDDGKGRLEVIPRHDLRKPALLRTFVEQIQTVAPHATGAPVVIVEAGRAVLWSFAEALGISLLGISIVLWLVLRRIGDVLLVFAPVCVAALWTLAVSAVFNLPFNFANVIVLPLLFGLSVDFGTHLVLRQRHGGAAYNPMATSTPRAVLLSALTTLGSFSSIMLSGHPGTASMGMLLSIAISLSLLSILFFLPALMSLFMPQQEKN